MILSHELARGLVCHKTNKTMNRSDFTNMSSGFTKVSKGYAMISGNRFYCELWLSVGMLSIQTRIFLDKSYTVSHLCNTWQNGGRYIFTNVQASTGGRWPRSNNDYVDRVIEDTKLQIFEEPRKWLTKEEKSVAELLALKCISREDLEWLLHCDVCDIPQAFWDYAKAYSKEYDMWCELQIAKHRAVEKWLTTLDGLEHLLANWPKYTDGKPFRLCEAISCITSRYDNIPAHVFSEAYNK